MTDAECRRFLPLVRRIAIRLARHVPSSVAIQDLIGWGWVGLIEAHARAPMLPEPELDAFVSSRARGAMLDYLRTLDPAKRRGQASCRRLESAEATLEQSLSRAPQDDELARQLGVSLETCWALVRSVATVRLARTSALGSEALDVLVGPEPSPADLVATRLLGEALATARERLPPRLRQVVALYYEQDRTLREIGELLGVSESRVCQLRNDAIQQLRDAIGDQAVAT
jgi:RNA polymerase sigma factor FliA